MKLSFIILFAFSTALAFTQNIDKHKLLEKIKQAYQQEVLVGNSAKPECFVNDSLAKSRVPFLNKDFTTQLFNRYNSVVFCKYTSINSNKNSLQITSILFENEKDLSKVKDKITSAKRNNFLLKALTYFGIIVDKNELVIISTLGTKKDLDFIDKYCGTKFREMSSYNSQPLAYKK